MCNFKVGQKVVCVDASNTISKTLVLNDIYTIVAIRSLTGGLMLKEAKADDNFYSGFFSAHRFRPLDHQFAEDVIVYIKQSEQVTI